MEKIKPLETLKKHRKKVLIISLLTKIPFMIYLFLMLSTVPVIDAVGQEYNFVKGAHRGDSVKHFENTLEAIKSSADNPEYEFIEFDIQYTKDKKILVFHDTALLRTTGRSDKIENLTFNEIQELTYFEVTTYEEVMNVIGNKKKIDIEIKSQGNLEDDKKLLDYIIKDCTERKILDKIIISSVSKDVLIYSKEKYPKIKTGKIYWITSGTYLPFDFLTKEMYKDIEEINADYIMLHASNIHNISDLTKFKPKNKTLVFWYFDNQMYVVETKENKME